MVGCKKKIRGWDLGKILCSTHLDTDKASWQRAAQVTPVENATPPPLVWNLAGRASSPVPRFQFSAPHHSLTRSGGGVGVFISFCIFSSGQQQRRQMCTFAILTRPPPTASLSANIADSRPNLSHLSHFLYPAQISTSYFVTFFAKKIYEAHF